MIYFFPLRLAGLRLSVRSCFKSEDATGLFGGRVPLRGEEPQVHVENQ